MTPSSPLPGELEEARRELEAVTDELAAVTRELDVARRELDTLRDELEKANAEVAAVNASLCAETHNAQETESVDAVLEALAIAAVTVDRDLVVRTWNDRAEAMWGVVASGAVGRALDELRTGLPADDILALVAAVMAGEGPTSAAVKGIDHQRRPVSYELTGTPVRTRAPEAGEAVEAVLLLARVLDR